MKITERKKAVGFVHEDMYESLYSGVGLNILILVVKSSFQGVGVVI